MRVRAAPIPKKCHVSIHFICVTTVSPRPHHLFPGWSFHLKLFSGFLLHKEPQFKFFIVFPIWPCLCRCDAPPHVHDHWSSCPWKRQPDSYLEGFLSAPPQLDLHCPFFNSLLSPQPSLSSERPSLPSVWSCTGGGGHSNDTVRPANILWALIPHEALFSTCTTSWPCDLPLK